MAADEITLRQLRSSSGVVAPVKKPNNTGAQPGPAAAPDAPRFDAVLRERLAPVAPAPLKFSAHAQTRLASREIPFGPAEQERLQAAVERAQAKGARESLILMDDVALVVSVKNRTVITAVDAASMKNSVFTNIDSAVIG